MNPLRRLVPAFLTLLIIASIGVAGYMNIEGWSFLDSIYMLVITLFTVGFREVHPLSDLGRLLTMGLIVSGVGTAVYAVGQAGEMIVEGQLFGYRRKKQMKKKLQEMKDHFIICGYGRVGHEVLEELTSAGIGCVVIDTKPESEEELDKLKVPYIIGDATANGNLEIAGIKTAKGLVTCADSDMENVFVTLSARASNPSVFIVARASGKNAESKLKMAGANKVISPYLISGRRMAALALRPVASDFLDMVMRGEHLEFSLREIHISEKSKLIGKSLAEAEVRRKSGATVLAIRKMDGGFNLQPLAGSMIDKGDVLVAVGTREQIELFEKMV